MYEFDIEMPAEYKLMLLNIVEFSKTEKSLSLYSHSNFKEINNFQFSIYSHSIQQKAFGDPLTSFECHGFIKIKEFNLGMGTSVFIVLPKAFEWADYQKKNIFKKWLQKLPSNIRDIGLFTSLVLSIISIIWNIILVYNNFYAK